MVKKTEKPAAKKGTKKPVKTVRKSTASKTSSKVDYYPNKMTVVVSAAAAVSLTLLAIIAMSSSL